MSLFPAYPLADYQAHQTAIDAAVQKMLAGGHYILGPEVAEFEREFAAFVQVGEVIGVANGTDAIELILRGLDIGAGDGVAVPSQTAVASVSAISRTGAKPVFVDVDGETATICPKALEQVLVADDERKIKAVLAVHLYGHPCEMGALQAVAGRFGVVVVEDVAQGHGATFEGRPVGSLARAAAFSFYPTKNLGAIGDGGAVATNDAVLAEKMRVIRQYGWVERYISACVGINSRLDELQAAILRVKLGSLANSIARRRELAALYAERLSECSVVKLPVLRKGCEHAYHLYVVRSECRDELMAFLTQKGIPVALHYPAAVHQQPAYFAEAKQSARLPNTERLVREILTLPLHPFLSDEAVLATCEAVLDFERLRLE
ncbi:DegT/DnrJ/EryC1/StrS family aminotransferase [Phragmitibacter flavus]|uniref:DegT/DnrJ/EryC1/StrS family aminotransferase n=1 Tax=Phragmitibacter flavus TaxID=2576071 RepID=A0A5R8KEU0_9BACT|nr:DegT/DnrJ/EryC1/StrS family aminotransferase [Phragmitibacter flavus]TLD70505.1 DegT/DnrJ/EryC1/StrS family aminotransferase [Phragmitibacter flavus]